MPKYREKLGPDFESFGRAGGGLWEFGRFIRIPLRWPGRLPPLNIQILQENLLEQQIRPRYIGKLLTQQRIVLAVEEGADWSADKVDQYNCEFSKCRGGGQSQSTGQNEQRSRQKQPSIEDRLPIKRNLSFESFASDQ